MSKIRQSTPAKRAMAVALGGIALSLTVASVQAATTQKPEPDQVCPPLNSGKIDTKGNTKSITIPNADTPSLPAGSLIIEYCVKAGSVNQGLGPMFVTVDPGQESVTFSYPAGDKAISHYSFAWGPAPSPSESPTEPEPSESPTEPEPSESPTEPEPSVTPSPTDTTPPAPAATPVPAPVTTVTPASPETPAPVDSDEVAPVEIADPGALPVDDEPAAIQPASPQQASVPTSVPAGGGAARYER